MNDIAKMFFGGDQAALELALADNNKGFAAEKALLEEHKRSSLIISALTPSLVRLFDAGDEGAVSLVISSLLGAFRDSPFVDNANSGAFLAEMAHMMRKATAINDGAEVECLWHDLVGHMQYYSTCNVLSDISRVEAQTVTKALREAWCNSDGERLALLQRCYFYLYDNIDDTLRDRRYYCALSDIAIMIDKVDFGAADRRHLFYTCYHCAVELSAAHWRR